MLSWWSQRRARAGADATERPSATPDATSALYAYDLALVGRAKANDPAAIDEVGARLVCVPRFLAQRNRRMGHVLSFEDLSDATQDAIAVLWSKLQEYRGDATLETWCYAIAGGVFMNAIRKRQRQTSRSLTELEDAPATTDPEPTDYAHVHRCLAKLPKDDEFLVRARAFDDWTFEALAEHSGRSLSALKARYYRALRKLQRCLEPTLRKER